MLGTDWFWCFVWICLPKAKFLDAEISCPHLALVGNKELPKAILVEPKAGQKDRGRTFGLCRQGTEGKRERRVAVTRGWVALRVVFLFCFVFVWERVSLCSPVWPRTHYVDETGWKLRDPLASTFWMLGWKASFHPHYTRIAQDIFF